MRTIVPVQREDILRTGKSIRKDVRLLRFIGRKGRATHGDQHQLEVAARAIMRPLLDYLRMKGFRHWSV